MALSVRTTERHDVHHGLRFIAYLYTKHQAIIFMKRQKPLKRRITIRTRVNKEVVIQVRVDKRFYKSLKISQKNLKIKKNGDFLRGLLYLGLLQVYSKEMREIEKGPGIYCSFK